ncbi:MAG: DUF1360 domain-containing protein [Actinomycetota bacterium]|nr:DUF1360 domain-containing protein [Actinomycetota bacterium]
MSTPTARPPYGSYAAIFGAFGGLLATAGVLGKLLDRDPQRQTALDFAVLGAATFKAARTLARDDVTSFIREPFVRGDPPLVDEERPVEGGMQQAMGELVTCTRCVGTWAAAGLASTQILAPRFGRLLTWSLGAAALNDFLQAGFASITAKANEVEDRSA